MENNKDLDKIYSYTILSDSDNEIRQFMGNYVSQKDVEYRISDFVVSINVPEGTLYYNSLTGLLILVKDFEKSKLKLIEEKILVPIQENERKFVDDVRKFYQAQPIKTIRCTDYWILTTTVCNAQCFYCFEQGNKHQTMTLSTAEQVAIYILDNYQDEQITLRWSGGEPLVNIKIIDRICIILKNKGVDFRSAIISNGYLFTQDIAKHAILAWNLCAAIITVDGTEDLYNKTKAYIHKTTDSAFKTVMTNIDALIKMSIHVIIRTNIGTFNMYNVIELYDYLTNRFLCYDNISVYPHIISNPPRCNFKIGSEQRKAIYDIIKSIKEPWRNRCIKKTIYKLPSFKSGTGLEFSGKQLVIKPTGEIAVNPDLFEDDHFGSVFNGYIIDKKRLAQYLEKEAGADICDKCPLYPTCFKRKIAFNSNTCTQADFEKCMDNTYRGMMELYKMYIF